MQPVDHNQSCSVPHFSPHPLLSPPLQLGHALCFPHPSHQLLQCHCLSSATCWCRTHVYGVLGKQWLQEGVMLRQGIPYPKGSSKNVLLHSPTWWRNQGKKTLPLLPLTFPWSHSMQETTSSPQMTHWPLFPRDLIILWLKYFNTAINKVKRFPWDQSLLKDGDSLLQKNTVRIHSTDHPPFGKTLFLINSAKWQK